MNTHCVDASRFSGAFFFTLALMEHRKLTVLILTLVVTSGAFAQDTTNDAAFADVPPCHWAAQAVNRLAEKNIIVGFPPEDSYLANNALRQVFAGLWCDEPSWSLRFLQGASANFGETETRVVNYDLEVITQELDVQRGNITFRVVVVLEQDGVQQTESREGTAVVVRDGEGWRVDYASLLALDLPIFPAGEQRGELIPVPATPTTTFRGG